MALFVPLTGNGGVLRSRDAMPGALRPHRPPANDAAHARGHGAPSALPDSVPVSENLTAGDDTGRPIRKVLAQSPGSDKSPAPLCGGDPVGDRLDQVGPRSPASAAPDGLVEATPPEAGRLPHPPAYRYSRTPRPPNGRAGAYRRQRSQAAQAPRIVGKAYTPEPPGRGRLRPIGSGK